MLHSPAHSMHGSLAEASFVGGAVGMLRLSRKQNLQKVSLVYPGVLNKATAKLPPVLSRLGSLPGRHSHQLAGLFGL